MTKKFINKKVFSAITKNLNWEILTENLVTSKRWDGVKDRGVLGQSADLRGDVVFLRAGGGVILQCTL